MTARDRAVKVFGERNTGTRAVIQMLERAQGVREFVYDPALEPEVAPFDAEIARLSSEMKGTWKRVAREAMRDARQAVLGPTGMWKHAAPVYDPAFAAAGLSCLFMIRNPYSWILSLHQRPYHALARRPRTLPEFLELDWPTVRRERVAPILPSPMALWSLKMEAYQRFMEAASEADVATGLLRFEDFQHAPAHALQKALREMGLRPSGIVTLRPTKPLGRRARERRQYYGQERWRDELTAEDVSQINAHVDWDLAARFGYTPCAPADFGTQRRPRPAAA